MEINRCISCESEIQHYPCPHCGFDVVGYQQKEYALPCNTILHGRYLIGKVLGEGGFGITYVGWDLALEIKVAIKEFYPNGQVSRSTTNANLIWYTTPQAIALKQGGMETFMKEARKMAKVEKIPEVVRVRDTFAENETAYIIMDFVEGETLKSRLENHGALSWDAAQKIFFRVIYAMEQVHQMGIIHRDLSPDNLMLLPDGGVNILDLGAAKDLSVRSGLSSMLVAKAGFSPIEQYIERGGSGTWTDVYAVAATMYYTLTGQCPPPAPDRMNATFEGKEDPLRWDLPQIKALPKNVVNGLKNALKISAKERTQTMEQLREQLKPDKPPVIPPKQPPIKPPEVTPITPPVDPQPEPVLRCTVCNTPLNGKGICPKCNPRSKKPLWILGAIAAVVLICLLSGVHVHKWQPATCAAPETCSVCRKTRGNSLPHTWVIATCTTRKHCTICKKVEGVVAKHDWKEATYDSPKTCRNCGKTEGNVKGYIERLSYHWGDMRIELAGTRATPRILDKELKNCIRMTLNFQITKVNYGNPYGRWVLYGKNPKGSWKRIFYFDVPDGNLVSEVIEFNPPESFTELFIANVSNKGGASWQSSSSFTDIYTRDDA